MIDKDKIQKLIEKYEKQSERNYQNFQETGESRYYRQHANADDMLSVLRVALNHEEEHRAYVSMRGQISQLRSIAVRARDLGSVESANKLVSEVIAVAQIFKL